MRQQSPVYFIFFAMGLGCKTKFSYKKNHQNPAKFWRNTFEISQNHVGKCIRVWWNQGWNFGHNSKRYVWLKKTKFHMTERRYPLCSMVVSASFFEAFFFQLELWPYSWWRELWTFPNNSQCWHKTFGLLWENWKRRGTSSFSTTMTQTTPWASQMPTG